MIDSKKFSLFSKSRSIWFLLSGVLASYFVINYLYEPALYSTFIIDKSQDHVRIEFSCENWQQAYTREVLVQKSENMIFIGRDKMNMIENYLNCGYLNELKENQQ